MVDEPKKKWQAYTGIRKKIHAKMKECNKKGNIVERLTWEKKQKKYM